MVSRGSWPKTSFVSKILYNNNIHYTYMHIAYIMGYIYDNGISVYCCIYIYMNNQHRSSSFARCFFVNHISWTSSFLLNWEMNFLRLPLGFRWFLGSLGPGIPNPMVSKIHWIQATRCHEFPQKNWRISITRWWLQIFFIFTPTLGKIPILTNIFQMGWNHQLHNINRRLQIWGAPVSS